MNTGQSHKPRKRFGQNFLHDANVIGRIVQSVRPKAGERLVEIGPGQGAITRPLLEAVGELHVIELDRDLVQPLENKLGSMGKLHIHQADALKFDFCSLADGKKIRLVGNLPYNISTPLLFHILENSYCIEDMHFMLQKEVVDRMAAEPGSGQYGRLSVMIQYHCEVEALFNVKPGSFNPPPKVDSSIVRLVPYQEKPVQVKDEKTLGELVTAAFSQRRKTLRNCLKLLLDQAEISECGVDPSIRPEKLNLAEFARLSDRLFEKRNSTSDDRST